uniref:Uncharacterized protein n=1 Tax=Arundo donax TaxID=35708 RepID=A0A0A9BPN8_ARUDO
MHNKLGCIHQRFQELLYERRIIQTLPNCIAVFFT